MNGYNVKEYLWLIIIALFILITMLSGCSSTPVVKAQKPQYCYTSQTIETRNRENIDSKTIVECTDDQIKRLAEVRLGMAANCGEFLYWMKKGGHDVQAKGISCQKPDGSWEIVNNTNY